MERKIFIVLLALVLAFPVFFGGNVNWAWDFMAFSTGLLLIVWAVAYFRGQTDAKFGTRLKWVGIFYGIVLLWVLVQAFAPVPEGLVSPIRIEAEAALGVTLPHVISLDPALSVTGLVRLITYGVIFFLVLQTVQYREDVGLGLKAFAVAAVALALYGLFVQFSGSNTVLWIEKDYYRDFVTSTFINRNSYATFAGFGLAALTALSLQNWLRLRSGQLETEKNNFVLNFSVFVSRYWWLIFGWAVVFTALLLTGSRAGILFGLIATLTLVSAYFIKRRLSMLKTLFVVGLLVIVIGLFFTLSGDVFSERLVTFLAEEGSEETRAILYAQALQTIGDYTWTGTGYDTYPYVYYLYRGIDVKESLRSIHAHNTYLENALELGILAAAAFLAVFVLLAWICYKGIRRRRSGFILPAMGLAITVQVGLHSLVDFSMEMPGVAATYAFLMALAVTQCWPGFGTRTGAKPGS